MPAESQAQQRLMGAAYGGSPTPAARRIRESLSDAELRAYASGSRRALPARVRRSSVLTAQLRAR